MKLYFLLFDLFSALTNLYISIIVSPIIAILRLLSNFSFKFILESVFEISIFFISLRKFLLKILKLLLIKFEDEKFFSLVKTNFPLYFSTSFFL